MQYATSIQIFTGNSTTHYLYINGEQRDKKDHITLVIRGTELYQIIGKSLQ